MKPIRNMNASATNTIYTINVVSSDLLAKLSPIGITGPIILTDFAEQRKFNITQKATSCEVVRTTDGNIMSYSTPNTDLVTIEISFAPTSQTIDTLKNLALWQQNNGIQITLSLTSVNPGGLKTIMYSPLILVSPYSGQDENIRQEDISFTFKGTPPSSVNLGTFINTIGALV